MRVDAKKRGDCVADVSWCFPPFSAESVHNGEEE